MIQATTIFVTTMISATVARHAAAMNNGATMAQVSRTVAFKYLLHDAGAAAAETFGQLCAYGGGALSVLVCTGMLQAGSHAPSPQFDNTTANVDDIGLGTTVVPPSFYFGPPSQEVQHDIGVATNPLWVLSMVTSVGLHIMKLRRT